MEPTIKKVKLTDHFRVALKPHDVNVQARKRKFKKIEDIKVKVPLILIDDDEPAQDENKTNLKLHHQLKQELKQELRQSQSQSQSQSQNQLKRDETRHHHQLPSNVNKYQPPPNIEPGVFDYDRSLIDNIYCEPHYAWDSFEYDREREVEFKTRRFFNARITPFFRARLIDWLVHIQDKYRLYHESLYTAVKMADQYLMRKSVSKENLQLLYLTCILDAVKFDERLLPANFDIPNLLLLCGNKYRPEQVISFERELLETLDFNIRYPLSYDFLRRYAHCIGTDKRTLQLARYILESSLLEHEMIEILESKLAAGALLLAYKMVNWKAGWDDSAKYYTGYQQDELTDLTKKLNEVISNPIDKRISTIRKKYNHEIHFSVAQIPPL